MPYASRRRCKPRRRLHPPSRYDLITRMPFVVLAGHHGLRRSMWSRNWPQVQIAAASSPRPVFYCVCAGQQHERDNVTHVTLLYRIPADLRSYRIFPGQQVSCAYPTICLVSCLLDAHQSNFPGNSGNPRRKARYREPMLGYARDGPVTSGDDISNWRIDSRSSQLG